MNSTKSILKSTGLIGGSKVISIIFNLIRAKVIALILGPVGTGFIGTLQSSTGLIQGFAGLGIQNSAVRDISYANTNNNADKLSKTIRSLRRLVLFTGFIGMLLTYLLAEPLSVFTFETEDFTNEIRILSIAVFFNLISAGQSALIQGMRRIRSLAAMSIIGAALSSLISIPFIYYYELEGIALYLVVLSISQYLVSLFYASQIKITYTSLNWKEVVLNAQSMLKLGISFMGGTIATLGTAYLIKVLLIRDFNLDGAGLYQAAIGISGIYINIILNAMGKDFYPRLTAVASQNDKEIELMNQQTEVGILLAAPGLLFTLALAPIAIRVLYSSEYIEAYPLLQWIILGIFIRTISWPMGYLFIARAKTKIFFLNQVVANIIHLVLLLSFTFYFGLLGAGIAFFGLYCCHIVYMYLLVKRENNYSWTMRNKKTISAFVIIFIGAFIILSITPKLVGSSVVCGIAIAVTYYTLKRIMEIMEVKNLKEMIKNMKKKK